MLGVRLLLVNLVIFASYLVFWLASNCDMQRASKVLAAILCYVTAGYLALYYSALRSDNNPLLQLRAKFLEYLPFSNLQTYSNDTSCLIDIVQMNLAKYEPLLQSRMSAKKRSARKNMSVKLYKELELDQRFDALTKAIYQNGMINQRLLRISKSLEPVAHKVERPNMRPNTGQVVELLQHFVRDWSNEGASERQTFNPPILEMLRSKFPETAKREAVKVLVPGSGLSRLAYEIAQEGFSTVSNELSYYMITATRFLFESASTSAANQHSIHPFVSRLSHHASQDSLLRAVTFPDVLPDPTAVGRMCFVHGDFLQAFVHQRESFDVVASLFFIDTAKNIVKTLQEIYDLLKPGGTWISLGPLLWASYADVELTLPEIVKLAEAIGFRIEEKRFIDTEYTSNQEGMFRYIYKSVFLVASKPASAKNSGNERQEL